MVAVQSQFDRGRNVRSSIEHHCEACIGTTRLVSQVFFKSEYIAIGQECVPNVRRLSLLGVFEFSCQYPHRMNGGC